MHGRPILSLFVFVTFACAQQNTSDKPAPEPPRPAAPPQNAATRSDLNLLGQTNTQSGESRRNENVQFNLIDNNALKELNIRLAFRGA